MGDGSYAKAIVNRRVDAAFLGIPVCFIVDVCLFAIVSKCYGVAAKVVGGHLEGSLHPTEIQAEGILYESVAGNVHIFPVHHKNSGFLYI